MKEDYHFRPHQESPSYITKCSTLGVGPLGPMTKQLNIILNSIDKYVDHEYKIGDFIYGLLYDYTKDEIVKQIKEIPNEISLIAQKTLDYIDYRINDEWWFNQFGVEAIEIFHIVCLLDLQQTKKYYEIILDPGNSIIIPLVNKSYKINGIYQDILKSYIEKDKLERELKDLRDKYKLLETHLKYMPEGEGYLEAKEHFESLKL